MSLIAGGCDLTKREAANPTDMFGRLKRGVLNARAVRTGLPFFWVEDFNRNGALDPRELALLWGTDSAPQTWVADGKLTNAFASAYSGLLNAPPEPGDDRTGLVQQELAQGMPTLVFTDLSNASASERAFVQKVSEIAADLEKVHMRQLGSAKFLPQLSKLDGESRALFYRNQAPWCMAPATTGKPGCNALPDAPPRAFGLYPADLQKDDDFCKTLAARDDAKELLGRHTAVQKRDGKLVAVPYSEAFAPEMTAVADGLTELASLVDGSESLLRTYILAAARAFRTNDWTPADEAWVRMAGSSSHWYLRVAPDAVFFSPCGRRAMMHLSLGRTDRRSRTWKRKLELVKSKMEEQVASLAGPPYRARNVELQVPDFVNIVLNAGDARRPAGAYIGVSFPNAGPLAKAGRRRTVAFPNLYADADSRASLEKTVKSYMCADTASRFSSASTPRIISTVLHSATRNLGPTSEHLVGGKTADEIFGTPMANMLDELKAMSSSLYFTEWLRGKQLIEPQVADEIVAFGMVWAFTHIARGLVVKERRLLHGHVGAIELGVFLEKGALVWKETEKAANGTDTGCFSLNLDKFSDAIRFLAKTVLRLKARGDVDAAKALQTQHVDNGRTDLFKIIQERVRRQPSANFVYAIRMGELK